MAVPCRRRRRALYIRRLERKVMTGSMILFATVLAMYSLLLFLGYRPLTRPEGVRLFQSTMSFETTTAQQRSRGQSSFVLRQERCFGITRRGFLLLAIFGYLGFAVAFVILSRPGHASR